jgi:hypothetical protein
MHLMGRGRPRESTELGWRLQNRAVERLQVLRLQASEFVLPTPGIRWWLTATWYPASLFGFTLGAAISFSQYLSQDSTVHRSPTLGTDKAERFCSRSRTFPVTTPSVEAES